MITKDLLTFPHYISFFGLRVQKEQTITECLEFFVPYKKGLLDFKIEFNWTFGVFLFIGHVTVSFMYLALCTHESLFLGFLKEVLLYFRL